MSESLMKLEAEIVKVENRLERVTNILERSPKFLSELVLEESILAARVADLYDDWAEETAYLEAKRG